jgi:acid phosphatase family membrane protein YuiD
MRSIFNVLTTEQLPEVKLKEFVGHTPVQVLAGILVGIVNAVVMYNFVF